MGVGLLTGLSLYLKQIQNIIAADINLSNNSIYISENQMEQDNTKIKLHIDEFEIETLYSNQEPLFDIKARTIYNDTKSSYADIVNNRDKKYINDEIENNSYNIDLEKPDEFDSLDSFNVILEIKVIPDDDSVSPAILSENITLSIEEQESIDEDKFAWYDAQDSSNLLSDGSEASFGDDVDEILDKSNEEHNLSGDTVSYVEDGINGLPSIKLDGSTKMESSVNKSLDTFSIALVVEALSRGSRSPIGSSSGMYIRARDDEWQFNSGYNAINSNIGPNKAIIIAIYDTIENKIYVNDDTSSISSDEGGGVEDIWIGDDDFRFDPFNGLIGEVRYYPTALSEDDVSSLQQELKDKWKF